MLPRKWDEIHSALSEPLSYGNFYDMNKGGSYFMGKGEGNVLHTPDSLLLTLFNYTLAPNNDSYRNLKS